MPRNAVSGGEGDDVRGDGGGGDDCGCGGGCGGGGSGGGRGWRLWLGGGWPD